MRFTKKKTNTRGLLKINEYFYTRTLKAQTLVDSSFSLLSKREKYTR